MPPRRRSQFDGQILGVYHAPPKRVWDAPPEPGPEVIAVRDRWNRLWRRADPPHSRWTIVSGYGAPYPVSWTTLFYNFGPLTEESP